MGLRAFEIVLVDLPQPGRDRRQDRIDTRRQPLLDRHDPLQHQLAGKVHIHIVFEHHRQLRERKLGQGTDFRQTRQAVHLQFDRIGDEAFHFNGREARRFRQHLHLHIGHIGVGIDGNGLKGEQTGHGKHAGQSDDEDRLAERELQQ
jgi:hypothetical protein